MLSYLINIPSCIQRYSVFVENINEIFYSVLRYMLQVPTLFFLINKVKIWEKRFLHLTSHLRFSCFFCFFAV